jgi:hypothetical protein
MSYFLQSIDVWQIVETGLTKPEVTTAKLTVVQTSARLSNDKALHAVCQAHSPAEFEEFHIVNLLKKHGQFCKQHIKARKL